jgi:amidophosphoribosyltransferase
LVPQIIEAIDNELDQSVFSFIPNTAEMSFYGMMKGLEDFMNLEKIQAIKSLKDPSDEDIIKILSRRARFEKIAIKDAKLRTFITQDDSRDDMVAHVYDITYGTVERDKDNLVVIDDSIVRGTTLKQSILKILDRLDPKRIVVVSSAPQIRFPDCYGIDMARMSDFIAFEAAIELLKENGKAFIIDEVYRKCKEQEHVPKEQIRNYVKEIYEPFTDEQISAKIAQLLKPMDIKAEVKIVYQTVKNLHKACPNNTGDWYFTGNYPTPGGNKVANRAFMNYVEGNRNRAY